MTTGPRGAPNLLGPRHKRTQRLRRLLTQPSYRQSERAFVVEGPKLVAEALAAGAAVEGLYAAPAGFADPVVGRAHAAGVRVFGLAPGVIERVAATATPQALLAVVGMAEAVLADLFDANLLVVCVDVRDPGNLGTIVRTAEAAGVGGVVCCEGTVDVYNPKCVRASAGSLFHVRLVARGGPVGVVLDQLGAWGMRRLGTAANRGAPYHQVSFGHPSALVMGNEAVGLPAGLEGHVDEWVTVPIAGRAESLNVAMAAAVVCFEAARQRGT